MNRFAIAAVFIFLSVAVYAQNAKQICITIDDLPANSTEHTVVRAGLITSNLLQTLKVHHVPAIGFVNEIKLLESGGELKHLYVQMLRAWTTAGMELGNHTYSHMDINSNSLSQFENDIIKGEQVTATLFNDPQRVKYFRHPYLHTGNTEEKQNNLRQLLKSLNYVEAPVTIDNSEWIFARAFDNALDKRDSSMQRRIGDEYIDYMMKKVAYFEKQSIQLFGRNISHTLLIHANTLNAFHLTELLDKLKANGYSFVSLGEALKDSAYASPSTYIGNGGISWIHRWAITQKKPKDFFAGEPQTPDYILKYAGIESE